MSKQSGVTLVAALTAFLTFAAMAPARGQSLTTTLETETSFVGASEDVVVRITYRNDSTADLYLVRWQTALRGVEANLFDVRLDGQPVAYTGRLYKRAHPTAADYLRIPARGAVSADVDLSSVYAISHTGELSIGYRAGLQDALRASSPTEVAELSEPRALESNRVFLAVERDGRAADALEKLAQIDESAHTTRPPAPRYVGCTNKRKSPLALARANAQALTSRSRDYLNALPAVSRGSDPNYNEWFGAYDPSRFESVTNDYANLASALSTKIFTFYCDCTEDHYAYVYADQPYKVHLCNRFWTAPVLGTDSKAGTLVHEASHFTVVAATEDYAYGQTACRELAVENPFQASHNADSHEYFAEPR